MYGACNPDILHLSCCHYHMTNQQQLHTPSPPFTNTLSHGFME